MTPSERERRKHTPIPNNSHVTCNVVPLTLAYPRLRSELHPRDRSSPEGRTERTLRKKMPPQSAARHQSSLKFKRHGPGERLLPNGTRVSRRHSRTIHMTRERSNALRARIRRIRGFHSPFALVEVTPPGPVALGPRLTERKRGRREDAARHRCCCIQLPRSLRKSARMLRTSRSAVFRVRSHRLPDDDVVVVVVARARETTPSERTATISLVRRSTDD